MSCPAVVSGPGCVLSIRGWVLGVEGPSQNIHRFIQTEHLIRSTRCVPQTSLWIAEQPCVHLSGKASQWYLPLETLRVEIF